MEFAGFRAFLRREALKAEVPVMAHKRWLIAKVVWTVERGRPQDRLQPHGQPDDKVGICAIYRKRNTSKPETGHKIYPYLLRAMKVERANQVWTMDITYIPMARGFVYLAAVLGLAHQTGRRMRPALSKR